MGEDTTGSKVDVRPDVPTEHDTLEVWLSWLEFLHPVEIELGLDRVATVAEAAGLLTDIPPVITVAGTNGKGSVVAMLASVYRASGFNVGTYTSPHIFKFNERISLSGQETSSPDIVSALAFIERHRGDVALTYFEYTTLAAMALFKHRSVDIAVLEVGLGGRLDAVNIWDAECAVLTSIALDHEDWLGSDRAMIATEKVSIARDLKPLVVAEIDPPCTISDFAAARGSLYWQVNRDYHYQLKQDRLLVSVNKEPSGLGPEQVGNVTSDEPLVSSITESQIHYDLPLPALSGPHQVGNAAAVVAVVSSLNDQFPVNSMNLGKGLRAANLSGRFEILECAGTPIIVDVAHNEAAAQALAFSVLSTYRDYDLHAVFAIMGDKAVADVITSIDRQLTINGKSLIKSWHLGSLAIERAMSADALAQMLQEQLKKPLDDGSMHSANIAQYETVGLALRGAMQDASTVSTTGNQNESKVPQAVLVFGSFFTVGEAVAELGYIASARSN